ncbi:hypothetical protein [Fibrella aestuarina]|uniref:hypothetical protein n=1 Tax=Fibrella aestuarina TaxID=651143 RepID=UPI00059CF025|nr:hypothetical protein [Fibrella aestuarina]
MSSQSTPKGDDPVSPNNFGCQLFKFKNVSDLLSQIDDRIDLMEKVSDDFTRIEGIDLIKTWRDLYEEIRVLWQRDANIPFVTLNKIQEIKLHVIADIVALFFLHNGDDSDKDFLTNVGKLFSETNSHYGPMTLEERFKTLKAIL